MSFLAKIDWNAFLTSDTPPILFVTAMAGLIIIVAIIAPQIRKTAEVRLKEQMVLRGYSSDEIIEVMASGRRPVRGACDRPQRAFLRTSEC